MVPNRNLIFLLLACFFYERAQAQQSPDIKFDRETILSRLREFEKWSWGLEFNFSSSVAGQKNKPFSNSIVCVSKDGRLVRSTTEIYVYQGNSQKIANKSARFSNEKKGWTFDAGKNEQLTKEELESAPSGSVGFSKPNTPALATSEVPHDFFGTCRGLSLSEYVSQSEVTSLEELHNKIRYRGVICDHPEFSSCKFLFDDQGLLRYIVSIVAPGDKVLGRNKYEPDTICPDNQASEISYGPIEYGDLEGRAIVTECEMHVKASNPEPIERHGVYRLSKHRIADSMSGKIEFPQFDWLVDGFKLGCQGNSNIECEMRNGEIVILVDRSSVDAARSARMGQRSGWGRFIWNSCLGVAGLGIFVFLVWYRNGQH